MEEEIKQRLTSKDIWIRGLTMLFFGIAYSIAELVIFLVAVFQFLTILFTGRANENALALGNNLSTYVYRVFQFQTFNTEERPFPFSDWPDEAVGETAWSGDSVDGDVVDAVDEEPVVVEDDPIIIDQDPEAPDVRP